MPFAHRRNKRDDGLLVCDGCNPDKPGQPGRPVGFHGSKNVSAPKVSAAIDPDDLETCQACGAPIGDAGLVRTDGLLRCGDGCKEDAKTSARTPAKASSTPRIAHDMGDGETPLHCPMCGSGQTTARSDGGIDCGFCGKTYTVRVQPRFPATPQTINGMPVDMPGMPGVPITPVDLSPDPLDAGVVPAPTATASEPGAGFSPAGIGGADGFSQAGSGGFFPAGSDHAAVTSSYRTATGALLTEESYLAHLAITYAADKDAAVDAVRAARTVDAH